ncbi:MAG: alkaline phosphatase family protein [Deltaproteobacteria bacterium]|nr:alkaline phosphatase family protein [Deltaproteobacteria bacterium]
MSRVFVIGLDGATLDLIRPWAEEGSLPGFARLMKDGAWGRLESTANQRSASAWTTIMTGKNPGKHGIYEFYEYVPGTYDIRFVNASSRDSESLWSILSDYGKKVTVINCPMTYPAEEVDGVIIAGLDSPGTDSPDFMRPESLLAELRERFGDYIIEPGVTGFIVAGRVGEARKKLEDEFSQKLSIARYLMETRPWDFFMVVFRSLDAAQHCFWKYMDNGHSAHTESEGRLYGNVIFDVYKKVDGFIEELLGILEPTDSLMVVSDHGFGRKHSATGAINNWLKSKGYLAYRGKDGFFTGLVAGFYKTIVGLTSRRLKERLARMLPALRNRVQSRLIFSGIDWTRTIAYSDTLFPNIRINLKGREPSGIVDPKDYGGLMEKLKSELSGLRDSKSGLPIVWKVFSRDEIYNGPHVDMAPDILIRWREDVEIDSIMIEGEKEGTRDLAHYPLIPGEDPRIISGDHRLNGIIFLKGADIKKGCKLSSVDIADFAPTALYLMDCPIPKDMDGSVIEEAFETDALSKRRPVLDNGHIGKRPRGQGYSGRDSEQVASRLRDLGYIE